IYLGVQMAAEAVGRSEPDDLVVSEVKKASFFSIVWQGVLVEVLNPKTIIFFVLFIPPFVDANGGGDVVTQLLILGALVPLTAIPSDVFVAYLGGSVAETVRRRPAVGNTLSVLGGVILIAIGLSLGLSD
ncbi:MAG: LysE family transporter, partial [Pseudomonadota bacterium]